MTQPFAPVPELRPEVWPRWLPAPNLVDRYVHHARRGQEYAACGAEVMWAEVGHPATRRSRCPACRRVVGGRSPWGLDR